MDNKKWYLRTATIFWFILSTLPLLITLINLIGFYINHYENLTLTEINTLMNTFNFETQFTNQCNYFSNFTPTLLNRTYQELFTNFGVAQNYLYIGLFFAWFTWVYFIHVVIDIMLWLPKLFHKWLERWE